MKRILLVDDEPEIIKLFSTLLERGGYSVVSTTSGEVALRTIERDPPDLVILDLSMPEPDGFEILKRIRGKQAGVRVLVVSGFLQGSLLLAAKYAGASAVLSKDQAPEQLLGTVDQLLGVPRN